MTSATPTMGRSITDLPCDILTDILAKLPTTTIFACSCVCKTWHELTSPDSHFAHLHFSRSPVELMVRVRNDHDHVSRALHLVDLKFDLTRGNSEVQVKTKLKIDLPKLDTNTTYRMRQSTRETTVVDKHGCEFVNSCRGLIYLCEPVFGSPLVVCNPITGEYISLPEPTENMVFRGTIVSGFGFSPSTNRYKVFRTYFGIKEIPGTDRYSLHREAEIHVLGSDSWRSIVGCAPLAPFRGSYAVFLNDALHWFCDDERSSKFIVSFDFETEGLGGIPPPPHPQFEEKSEKKMSIGVLRDCLFVCDGTSIDQLDIWVMKEYGVQESWSKEFVINAGAAAGLFRDYHEYRPIKCLGNGEVLMLYDDSALIWYDQVKGSLRILEFCGMKLQFEAIIHNPTFVSLKDIVMGDNVKVLNVRSRYAGSEQGTDTEAPQYSRSMASYYSPS